MPYVQWLQKLLEELDGFTDPALSPDGLGLREISAIDVVIDILLMSTYNISHTQLVLNPLKFGFRPTLQTNELNAVIAAIDGRHL